MPQQQQNRQPKDMSAEGHPVGVTEFSGSTPASDGWHDAVIAEIVDLGLDFKFNAKGDHRGMVIIQLDETAEEGDFAGQRKETRIYFSYDIGLGSSEKGTDLRRRLEEWRGTPFTSAELEDMRVGRKPFQLGVLEGKPLRVMTATQKAKTSDKESAKVIKFGPANKDKDLRLSISDNYERYWDRESSSKPDDGKRQATGSTSSRSEPWEDGGEKQVADDDDVPW